MRESTQDFEAFMGRLYTIRDKMASSKNDKLSRRWPTHGDYRQHNTAFIIKRVRDEVKELNESLDCNYPHAIPQARRIKDEVIDVSNMLDFLWDALNLGAV